MPIQITLSYAGFLGLLLVLLSFNVMQNWVRVTGKGQETDRDMRRAERILASFVEYVPFALILLVLIEIKGAPHIRAACALADHGSRRGAFDACLWQQSAFRARV